MLSKKVIAQIETLHYFKIEAHLIKNKWTKHYEGKAVSTWTKGEDCDELLLPLNTTFRDYGRRMVEAFEVLSQVEDKCQCELIKEFCDE